MNIFPSKLKHIKFQNSNLGGVNYEDLKAEQELTEDSYEGMVRTRRSTMQEQSSPSVFAAYSYEATKNENSNLSMGHMEIDRPLDSFSFAEESETKSNKNSTTKSFNTFDIDEQFRELARESEEYR